MKPLKLACIAVLAGLPCLASAESLRCAGGLVSEGDSRLSVIYKCGQPLLSDTYCAAVYYPGSLTPIPEPFASAFVPCQQIEEWLYERGPGNMMATVYLRSGVVQSIAYGRQPR
ncbi:DUF2845 domain-containing protein [Variovorax saccharolyticus]|uniref:DUF2845 domain-containing protein n=1 Tax=Variovorax saccharolyticus TaxID=3053516 RepID=UPI002576E8E6|nr:MULTISPECIES: DUF2845 domain-containing protein [unclassified Variovorax]MDM0021471.1 DUF2845 domain-containing protein [Variovorax sp. J22R187]MDM0027477.1 DUF2845 domain-containing protein [Variovorax sp. J31P216]